NHLFRGMDKWESFYEINEKATTQNNYLPNKYYRIENIYFAFDSSILEENSFPSLDSLANILMDLSFQHIEIVGHTDSLGSTEYNDNLSLNRAKSVMNYLIHKGIDSSKIKALGKGSRLPITDNNTEIGRQKNRR